jgi:hypothetical protein
MREILWASGSKGHSVRGDGNGGFLARGFYFVVADDAYLRFCDPNQKTFGPFKTRNAAWNADLPVQWVTTAPNPRVPATGVDAGQRGWKLHAVHTDSTTFSGMGCTSPVCGLWPSHGWSLDLFIEDKCSACERLLNPIE